MAIPDNNLPLPKRATSLRIFRTERSHSRERNNQMSDNFKKSGIFAGLGRNVIVLGVVSLFTDISSEMLYPVIPMFLTLVLHAPMSVVGLIEGIAESTASILKYLSGYWSDKIRRQVPFVVAGYGISAISKPLLALAGAWPMVLTSRFIDRVGKGIRTTPRDALIAASCAKEARGKAYGLHRAMDTIGAVFGPVVAIVLLKAFSTTENDPRAYRWLFIIAFIPALLGVLAFLFLKKTPAAKIEPKSQNGRNPLSPELKRFLVVIAIFSLGNSSDVFLLLRAKSVGFSESMVLAVYVLYNFVYATAATPAGWLSDRLSRRTVLTGGFLVFAFVYAGFAFSPSNTWIWILFAVYGLYAAANEGVAKAYVADMSTSENRGTAMGAYQLVIGIMAFVASTAAGLLVGNQTTVNAAPFIYGAVCSIAAAIAFFAIAPSRPAEARTA